MRRLHDAVRDVVTPRDPAENVEEDDLDSRVGRHDPERGDDFLCLRAATDVQEVGGLATVVLHEIHRGHREPGPVHAAAHIAVQLDEGQPRFARRDLLRRFRGHVSQGGDVRPPLELVVIDDNLGVERLNRAFWRRGERVDLGEADAEHMEQALEMALALGAVKVAGLVACARILEGQRAVHVNVPGGNV